MTAQHRVETWTNHGFGCTTKHKTDETFIRCALRKQHNGHRWSVSSIGVEGEGNWATVDQWFVESYGEHNGKRLVNSYYVFNVTLHETYEAAVVSLDRLERIHSTGSCSSTCVGYLDKIVNLKR